MAVRSLVFGVLVASGLGACEGGDKGGSSDDSDVPTEVQHAAPDADLDGFAEADGDCDDLNGGVYPGAQETCDGLDNDCNGTPDDGISRQFYVDMDGDGFGDPDSTVEDCKQSEGVVLAAGDCNDRDAAIHPDAHELCDEADVDEDCDGLFGADDPDVEDARVYYVDVDGDGYGRAGSAGTLACDQPTDLVTNDYDCVDDNPFVNPSRLETCDDDARDDDCDGLVDDADPESLKAEYWPDADGDDYGDEAFAATYTCFDLTQSGYVLNGEDCDDQVGAVNPDATELCGPDHVDDDCDGRIDEADSDTSTHNWYVDNDADGYGQIGAVPIVTCQIIEGSATRSGDCNDDNGNLNPGADELCNSRDIDEDCDGDIDEADSETPPTNYYIDTDGDGYGESATLYVTCDDVTGYVTIGGDCDESEPSVHPNTFDDCEDSVDNDCDGAVDNCSIGAVSMLDGDAIIVGNSPYTYTSNRIARAGDIDGDGNGDLAIASFNLASYYGNVSLMFGPVSGSTTLASSDVDVSGGAPYQNFGWSLAGERDQNGDGATDLIVGEQYGNYAYLFYGPLTADTSGGSADATLTGAALYDQFGRVVDLAGDFDGDGFGEVVVTAPYASRTGGYSYAGVAYIWSGPMSGAVSASTATYSLGGSSAYDQMTYTDGFQNAAVGDMNGDGLEEIALSAPWKDISAGFSYYYDAGQVYISYGGTLVPGEYDVAAAAGGSVVGESSYQGLGWTIADSSDYNGDGYADLVANAYQGGALYYSSGLTYVIEGPISGTIGTSAYLARLEGDQYDNSGLWGIATGDFNADGKSDVLVSAANHTTGTCYGCGGAYLALGGIEGSQLLAEAFATITGPSNYSSAGQGTAFVDDWDSDGKDEVAVSETNDYSYYSGAGSTSVFSGDGLYP
jgi:hypothetical protein